VLSRLSRQFAALALVVNPTVLLIEWTPNPFPRVKRYAAANFAMESEPLLHRGGALYFYVYSVQLCKEKRELEAPLKMQGLGVYLMNRVLRFFQLLILPGRWSPGSTEKAVLHRKVPSLKN
jgi:hypothetical protein